MKTIQGLISWFQLKWAEVVGFNTIMTARTNELAERIKAKGISAVYTQTITSVVDSSTFYLLRDIHKALVEVFRSQNDLLDLRRVNWLIKAQAYDKIREMFTTAFDPFVSLTHHGWNPLLTYDKETRLLCENIEHYHSVNSIKVLLVSGFAEPENVEELAQEIIECKTYFDNTERSMIETYFQQDLGELLKEAGTKLDEPELQDIRDLLYSYLANVMTVIRARTACRRAFVETLERLRKLLRFNY